VKLSPRTGQTHDFYVIESCDWINVIALTEADELVMIDQYRHGSDTIELELPGGMIDKADESPLAAGIRELREETGYVGGAARIIGECFPNPAVQNNRCYTALVENCRYAGPLELDHPEDVLTRLVPARDLPGLVASGRIRHALMIAALYYFESWRRGRLG
jgi:8-oxo-dGTP pyrophosphatase MutT (NUDIX family)